MGAIALIFCFSTAALKAQDKEDPDKAEVLRRLESLEKEVAELRGAMAKAYAPHLGAEASAVVAAVPPAAPEPAWSRLLGSTRLSGSVDIDFEHNLNRPASRMSGLRAFDAPADQFSLNLAELVLDKPARADDGRLGFRVALGFGEAMETMKAAAPGDPGLTRFLKEAYLSYLAPVGSGLTLDVGKFVTPMGAEVIETQDNWNYTRGLLFTYAIPFDYFGLRAKYAIGSQYSLAGYVVNGWNNVVDNNRGKTLGASFGWTPSKKFSLMQSYLAGPEACDRDGAWRQLSDTVASFNPTQKLWLMLNYDYGHDHAWTASRAPVFWTGVGGYARYVFNPRYTVAARYEYFDDHDGFTTGTAQHLNEITGTVERILARRLLTRLEVRRDLSSAPVFLIQQGSVTGQTTVAAGMVYRFDAGSKP